MRTLFVSFLVAHAAVHGVMWSLPFTNAVDDMAFNPAESWLLGKRVAVAAALAAIATIGFVVTAIAFATRASWWPELLGTSAAVSLGLMLLFLSPYWIVGIAINTVLAVHAWQVDPAS